jgi:hypothetical protein
MPKVSGCPKEARYVPDLKVEQMSLLLTTRKCLTWCAWLKSSMQDGL